MQAAGLPIEQVIERGTFLFVVAATVHGFAGYAAIRFENSPARALSALLLSLSFVFVLLGGSVAASSITAIALRGFFGSLQYEVFITICFVGGIVGIYLAAFVARLSNNIGTRLAGTKVAIFEWTGFWRFRTRSGADAASSNGVGRWYGLANKIAWVLSVLVIASCFWHDASSGFLFGVSVVVAVSTAIEICFRPGLLSLRTIRADMNAGLATLTFFAPLGLALRAMYRFELVDWRLPLVLAVLVGWPATIARLHFLPWKRQPGIFSKAFFSLFFCYTGTGSLVWSALQFANDMSGATLIATHRVHIAAKHEQRGKYDTMYWINAANPPDLNGIDKFKTRRIVYENLSVGGDACIEVWSGMVALRWYKITGCEGISQVPRLKFASGHHSERPVRSVQCC